MRKYVLPCILLCCAISISAQHNWRPMQHIRPPYLHVGDTVAVCNASNRAYPDKIEPGIRVLESWGLTVVRAANLYSADGRYGGTEEERASELQHMMDSPGIKAIFMARGGYGASQLLDRLSFGRMRRHPKWVIGFSDATALHIALNNAGIESIHGPMMSTLGNQEESGAALHSVLFNEGYDNITIETNENCVKGKARGRLVGGNLSLIYSEQGTPYNLNMDNAILFIEETDEYSYSIDRMLTNLRLSGKLYKLRGIVIGAFVRTKQDPGDPTAQEVLTKRLNHLGIPVMYGAPCGHVRKNLPLILGSEVTLEVNDSEATLRFVDR